MDAEERFDLLARNTEEIVTAEELKSILATNPSPKSYIGFEPSGLVHLGWVICANKVRDLVDTGFDMTIFFADWHAYINDKLGGDIERIRTCARYMEDCFEALGVPRDRVRFVLASEIMGIDYWEMVMKVGKVTSLSRIKRAMTIMGRKEDDAELDSSKFLYPLMQATDIFRMDIDVAYSGIDQRRAHMLAR
jgi:tyrosyl-tRNA synthetase